jgi:hypothetical protein
MGLAMPATPNNPGVSIQQLPSGVQPIAGVAPSITAVATSMAGQSQQA